MKKIYLFTLRLFIACALASAFFAVARAQQAAKTKISDATSTNGVDVNRIIQSFTQKEAQFRSALNEYSFKRDAVIQTIGFGGQVTGEYHRTSSFVFDDKSNRYEKILFFPVPTLQEISVTEADLEDLGGVNPFALEVKNIDKYNFTYVGKERIDEIDTYVFDVTPKVIPAFKNAKERYFQGRIWVDDQDLQIVKSRGKGVPEDKNNKFPIVETYRQQIDGKYWFPTYTYSDDTLVFGNGHVVHLKMRVKYTDFEKLKGKVRVIEEGEPGAVDAPPAPTPTPAPPKKP
jgi:hypothetical protein